MKFITINILLLISIHAVYTQTWPRYYGQPNRRDGARKIIETYDNGYLILGDFFDTLFSKRWAWVIKTDMNGNILWEKIFENSQSYTLLGSVEQSEDGGYLFCGGVAASVGIYQPVVVKLNACGEKEWCKIFGGSPNATPWAQDIKETESGDIVVLVNQFGNIPQETIHLFKLTAQGEVIWKKAYATMYNYPHTNIKYGRKLLITNNNKYLISGYGYWEQPWNPGGPMPLTSLFIMSDSDGNEEWVLPFGLSDTIIGQNNSSIELPDGSFVGVGANLTIARKGLLMKTDVDGNQLMHSTFDFTAINPLYNLGLFVDILVYDSLTILASGYGSSSGPITAAPGEIVVDSIAFSNPLNVLNSILYTDNLEPYSVNSSTNNKYLSTSTFRHSSTNYDIFLAKLNLNLEYDTAYTLPITYDSLCTSGPPQSGFIYLNDCAIDMDLPGDANCDAAVNVNDVVSSVAKILGGIPQPFCPQNADVNGDGVLNVADVVGTVNIIMSRRGRN